MAEETFAVLRDAMQAAGKVAIARLVMSSRERVVTIGAREKGMFVTTLRDPREVRATSTYFDEIPDIKADPEMLQLAETLIKQKVTKFDIKNYDDRYEVALREMIKEKLKGHKPIIAAAPERGNVINLMDALKASLGQAKPAAPSKSKAEAPAEEGRCQAVAEGGRGRQARPQPPRRRPRRRLAKHPWRPGPTFGIVGALRAFPQRLAARAVAARGGRLRRGITRQTQRVVLGRKLLDKLSEAEIETRIDALRDAGIGCSARTASCASCICSKRPSARRCRGSRCSINASSMATRWTGWRCSMRSSTIPSPSPSAM